MSRDCDDALTRIYRYLDDEIDQHGAATIRAHLEDCQGCEGRFDFERRLKAVVRERLSEEVPQRFIEQLREVLHHESTA